MNWEKCFIGYQEEVREPYNRVRCGRYMTGIVPFYLQMPHPRPAVPFM